MNTAALIWKNSAQCNDDKTEASVCKGFMFTVMDCLTVCFSHSEEKSQMMLTVQKNECTGKEDWHKSHLSSHPDACNRQPQYAWQR